MNKIYRLKFSKRLNQLVAVSEITTGHDRHSGSQNEIDTSSSLQITKFLKLKLLAGIISILSFGFATQTAMANGLQGMEVVSGSASMSINGKNTTITNSPDAIINWKQFNIDQDELVRFVQENSNSAVFNRVTSDQISQLKGALNSNGHVFLINPNGIVMGKDAVINAAGFTASTLNISDKDLKARNFNFEQAKDKAMAQIVNNGLISVSKNGSVNLIGGSVKNNGVIKVEDGNILLLAGQKVTISDITNPTITYSVVAPKNEAVNLGTIFAKNGKIQMHAGSVVNKGALNANSVRKDKSGVIILSAKEGEANIDGTVTLNNANFKAGSLTITGKKVVLNSGAKVELTGKQGGTVYIGGDERGQGKIQLAEKTEIKQGARVNVSGSEKGGKAIVWGDRAQVDGKITAKGKDKKNSGFVETSGKYLGVGKTAKVEAKEWLLDPYNVRIVSAPDTQTTGVKDKPAVTITGTEQEVKILNTTIQDALNKGTNVTITTTEPVGSQPVGGQGDFTVEADIIKTSGDDASLTLTANGKFTQNENTEIKSESGKLNLTINAGNDLMLKGKIDTKEGDLNISTKGNATLDGATVKGKGTISINPENSGNSDRTLEVKGDTTLKGYGEDGLSIKVSDKAKIKGTWEGNINVTGNVSYVHTLADHIKESHHDWAANLTVENGKFTFSDLNNHNQIQDGVTQNEPILNISKAVKFDVKNSTDTATFDVKQHGGSAGTNSLLGDNSSDKNYISKLATHINGNLTVRGGGVVNINSTTPSNSVVGGILIKSTEITTADTATLNLTGKAESEAQQNPAAVVVESDLTLNASENSKINLHGSGALGATAIYVGKNVRNYAGNDYKVDVNKSSLTLKGNNINITAAQNKKNITGNGNAAKITITGDLTSDAKNVYLGEKDDARGVNINLYGNTTFNSGNVTLNSKSDNVNAKINLNDLTNNANLNITGSVITFNGGVTSNTSMNVTATSHEVKDWAAWGVFVKKHFNSTGPLNITAKTGGMLVDSGDTTEQNAKMTFNGETNIKLGAVLLSRGRINTADTVDITAQKIKLGGDVTQNGGHLTLTTTTENIETDVTNKVDKNGEKTNSEENTITFNGNDNSQLTIKTPALVGNWGKIKFKKYGDSNLTLNATKDGGEVALKGTNSNPTKMGIEFEDSTLNVGAGKLNVETTVTGKNDLAIKKADGNANLNVEITNTGKLNSTGQTSVDATTVTNNGAISGASVALTATETVTNNATVTATTGDATLTGENVSNSGTVTATEGKVGVIATENFTNTQTGNLTGKNIETTSQNAEINGAVNASENVSVTAKADATISGTVTAAKNATINAENNATINGTVTATAGKLTVDAKKNTAINGNVTGNEVALNGANTLNIKDGVDVKATGGDAKLKGGDITNSGAVTASQGNVGVIATGAFINTETGNLTGKNNVTVTAENAEVAGKVTAEAGKASVVAQNKATISGAVSGQDVELEGKKGLTINQDATVTATEDNVTLKGSSIEQNGTVKAKQNATLEGNTITNSGTVKAETGKVGVTATEKFTNTETGNLKGGNVEVTANQDAIIKGTVSGTSVALDGKNSLTIEQNAQVTATEGDATLKGKTIEQKGTVTAKQNATLEGNTITNSGTVKAETGKVGVTAKENFTNTETGNLKGGNVEVTANQDAIIKGTVSGTSVTLDGKNSLTIEQNAQVTATEGDATLKGNTIEQKGTVTAKQNATLEGNAITNSGTVTAETGKVSVTATEKFTNTETGNLKGNTGVAVETKDADIAGTVTADTGDLTITAKNDAIIKGTLDAKTGAASITATNDLSIKEGSKVSGGSVGLKAGENLNVAENAQMEATKGDATLKGKAIDQKGTVTAKQNATLEGNTITNSGTVTAETGKVGVTATENFTNTETGNLTGNNVDVKVKNALNEGEIQAEEGNLTVKVDETFVNTESGILDAKEKVEVKAEDATIAGEISGGVVSLTADKTLDIAKDSFVTAKTGEAKLSGDTITNAGTVVAKEGEVSVNATGTFTNTADGNLAAKNAVDIKAKDAEIAGKVVSKEGTLTVNATRDLTVKENADLSAKNKVTLAATNDLTTEVGSTVKSTKGEVALTGNSITNSGMVTATEGNVGVTATEKFTNTETGNLTGKNNVTVTAENAEVAGTVTAETGAASITATNDLSIKEGSKVSGGSVGLKAGENLNVAENAGVTATEGDATLAGKNISNSGTVTAEKGNVGVTATEKFTNTATGNLTGKNNVTVTAENAEVAGTVTAETGATNITATNDLSIKEGSKVSGGSVGLKAGENLNVAENAGVTATEGDATLAGKNISNSGTVGAKGNVDVNAKENFTNQSTGNLNAKGKVTVNAETGNVDNKGVINGNQGTSVTAGQDVTNHEGAEITSTEGKVDVNAQNGSVDNNGLIQGKTGTDVTAKNDVNNGETGKILSPAGNVSVNAETGAVNNKGVVQSENGQTNVNGVVVNNTGILHSKNGNYCINNLCSNTFVEAATAGQSKDSLMLDLIDTLGDMERTVRSNLSTVENEQYPSSSAKSLMFYDKGRGVNKVASIISNGSVCSVVLPAGKNIADGRLLTSCLAENEKSKAQYHKQSEKVDH